MNRRIARRTRLMAVDFLGARRQALGKENETPVNAKGGSGNREVPAFRPTKQVATKKDETKSSRGVSNARDSQKPRKGTGGKPPKPPSDATSGPEVKPSVTKHERKHGVRGVTPNELVAGLAGSAVFAMVSGVSRLVKARMRPKMDDAAAEKKTEEPKKEKMPPTELAKLEATKGELREAMAQLRELRKTLDHLARQNREMARENVLLKKAARAAAAVAAAESSSRRTLFVSTASQGSPEQASLDDVLRKVLPVLDATNSDETALAANEVARNALANVLRNEAYENADGFSFPESTSIPDSIPPLGSIGEYDAWAGVPRGSPGAGSDLFDSAASGVSGVSDLSTVSAAQAALTRTMHNKYVLMARIKNHR